MVTISSINRGWSNLLTKRRIIILIITILSFLGLYAGWRLFWFLTDDAYIAFRYVSNSRLGYGYTWNLPPFRPVEGYTSFLWVLLLDIIWRLTDQPPPLVANNLAFLFACGTLTLTLLMLLKQTHKSSLWIFVLVLVGILTNRTFLAWTSSGLETAMFNFWVLAWVFSTLKVRSDKWHWAALSAISASFTALTRPDGLLLIAATLLLLGLMHLNAIRARIWRWQQLIVFAPFLPNTIHLIWRKARYGEWLPNTHAAKISAFWPESGLRYLLSFILEYGLWLWLLLLSIFVFTYIFQRQAQPIAAIRRWWPQPVTNASFVTAIVIGTLTAHFGYYTLVVGGDHFEYRVYSHLIPLIFISALWLLKHLSIRPIWQIVWVAAMIIVASPIPWVHWAQSQQFTTREQTFGLTLEVAPYFPPILQPYVHLFDIQQEWLISRAVGIRHQEHKIFLEYFETTFPSREQGLLLEEDARFVFVGGSIGIPGWAMPTVNIIDTNGLTDYVVARNPASPPGSKRIMAHERYPPIGYAECFQPNITYMGNKIVLHSRELSDEDIRECESKNWPPTYGDKTEQFRESFLQPLDFFIWNSWSELPIYLSVGEPNDVEPVLDEFIDYKGIGCAALTDMGESADPPHWFILLHDIPDQTHPPAFQAFSWYQSFLTDRWNENIIAHDAAWAAPNLNGFIPQPTTSSDQQWPDGVTLTGYDLPTTPIKAGETADLNIYFNLPQGLNPLYSFFVNLADQDGNVLVQYDGNPCSPLLPAEIISPDTRLIEKTFLEIPPGIPAGDYTMNLGIVNWQTGEQISPISATQSKFQLGTIRINGQ